ncbi:MAG: hypothetical protein CFE21_12980 [Bacteroidetes bacterium B1(2017)]|nr:MAG: hypothetical protein CFE21_12980 [Bacteroidetes bacterium B1(2017)]
MEKPYSGAATINESFEGFEIIIPTKKNWFVILFLGFWLCGWVFGEVFALTMLTGLLFGKMEFANLFMLVWLGGWTVGGFFAIKTFLWNLKGKEIITIGMGQLKIEKKGLLLAKPKTYDLIESKNFRAQEDNNGTDGIWGMQRNSFAAFNSGGTIRFDYGLKTIKFAGGIDEAEANYIIEKLKTAGILKDSHLN